MTLPKLSWPQWRRGVSGEGVAHPEKHGGLYVESRIPRLTLHSFIMGIFVSMGGFIFGYDTGQISGFLGMEEFLMRFGQRNDAGEYYFSNVRSGLIVGLVGKNLPLRDLS